MKYAVRSLGVVAVMVVILLTLWSLGAYPHRRSLPDRLQSMTVMVRDRGVSGSGTLILDRSGRVWVLTAAHVVSNARVRQPASHSEDEQDMEILEGVRHGDSDSFLDVEVVHVLFSEGRPVGETVRKARVVKYSDPNDGIDAALLSIQDDSFSPPGYVRSLQWSSRQPGNTLAHCGNFFGMVGVYSYSEGVISFCDRWALGRCFDQVTVTAFPGSSGGPVVDATTGEYLGMLTNGYAPQMNLMVPVNEIIRWGRRVGVDSILEGRKPPRSTFPGTIIHN